MQTVSLMASLNSYDDLCMLIIIGCEGVGKSCLGQTFVSNKACLRSRKIGVTFEQKIITLDNVKVKLQVWDLIGNLTIENIDANVRPFLPLCQGVVLVYDLTDKDTLMKGAIQLRRLSYSVIGKRVGIRAHVILVGTKSDLVEERQVYWSDIMEVFYDFQISCFETSLHDVTSIEYAFMHLVAMIYPSTNSQ